MEIPTEQFDRPREQAGKNANTELASATLSLFHNRYSDPLSVEGRPEVTETSPGPVHTVIPLFLRNGVNATSTGGEVAGLIDVPEGWRIRSSYSLLHLDAKLAGR